MQVPSIREEGLRWTQALTNFLHLRGRGLECGIIPHNAVAWPDSQARLALVFDGLIKYQGNRRTCQWRTLAARHGSNGQIEAAGKFGNRVNSQLRRQCLPAWWSVAGCPVPLQRLTQIQFALRSSNTQCSYSGMCSLWTMAEYH